jgi:carbamoyl-phosphate synthase large subunit
MMKGKNFFVSGGAGVIGLELVPKLVAYGANVYVGDLKARPKSFDKKVLYRQGDLNYITVAELDGFKPEVFIHLAATFERTDETYHFWTENFNHNVILSHHLMDLVKDLGSINRVVFASSYLIYDPALYQFDSEQEHPVSLKESDPILPRNLTGMAKLAHEIELRFISQFKSEQFTTVCARIYRGYGRNSRDVISRWIRSALTDQPITVFRPEGIFDYIYAADSAEGLIRLAYTDSITGLINLGTGRSRKVQDVVDVLSDNFPSLEVHVKESSIPFEASQADMTVFEQTIDWMPKYDLERSIPEIIEFERSKFATPASVKKPLTVLVTSASKKIPLINAVKVGAHKISSESKVIAGDISENVLSKYIADEFWLMPRAIDDNVDEIIVESVRRGVNVILPTRDGELAFWSKYKAKFLDIGISIIVSPQDSIARCLDKLEFSEFGKNNELPFIQSSVDIADIQAKTYVVKERFGAGSKSIGINLGLDEAVEHGKTLMQPIFQPFIPGVEISIDGWLCKEGSLKGLVIRKRDLVENGESQVTSTFRHAAIEKKAAICLESLNISGPAVMQAIITKNHEIRVIECNSRFGGASTTAIAAGLDIFFWSLQEALGNSSHDYSFHRIVGEIKQVRVPSDIYVIDDTNI